MSVETKASAVRVGGITEAFTAVAQARPDHVALVWGPDRISYRELADRAAAVAARLAGRVDPGEPVAVCATRSPGTIATLLGVLQAGAAYLPLDPDAPDRRLAQLVSDSAVRTLFAAAIDVPRLRESLPDRVTLLPVDEDPAPASGQARPAPSETPDALAYVIYTSGSSGRPKGVLVEHRSVLALAELPGLADEDVFLQLAPLHVDPSVFEIFGALLNGATLVLPDRGRLSVHDIGRQVAAYGVTVLRLAAPMFRLATDHILPSLASLRLLISGGDQADEGAVRRALAALPGCVVVNGYGPTETTVYACWHPMRGYDESWPDVPIGRPVPGATAVVVDDSRAMVRPGEAGELCITGPGVARGYLGRPDLTADQFVPDPQGSGRRAYLTGDRVRQLPDGNLVFLGRVDDQVKIRGHRVEPAEIERALRAHPAVAQATVIVQGQGYARGLVAAAVPESHRQVTGTQLRSYLAERLPEQMVPVTVRVVAELPVTANGKVDRRLLAQTGPPPAVGAVSTETATEGGLRRIWQEVLGLPAAGLDTSFLSLGGDSLAALAVLARIEQRWEVALPASAPFEAQTIRRLAGLVDTALADAALLTPAPADHGADTTSLPLLPGQEGVWYEAQTGPPGRYTITRTFLVEGRLEPAALTGALTALADRQQALRTVVQTGDTSWAQVLIGDPAAAVRQVDLSGLPADAQRRRAAELIADSAAADPRGGLVRTLLLDLGGDRTVLHFDLHHVIGDDRSVEIFLRELSALYAERIGGPAAALPALTVSYPDLVRAARADRPSAAAVRFWRDALEGRPDANALICDRVRPAVLSGQGGRVTARLDAAATARLTSAAKRGQVSRFMMCAAAVHVVLSRYTEQDDVCLGALASTRTRAGTDALIGYFLNILPIRVRTGPATTVAALLTQVRDAVTAMQRHLDTPLQTVARELGLTGLPFPVVINYQPRRTASLRLAGAHTTAWPELDPGSAKFEICVSFREDTDGIDLEIEYSSDLYRRDVVDQLARHVLAAVDLLCRDDAVLLDDLDLAAGDLPRPAPAAAPDCDTTLTELVALAANLYPDKTAAVGAEQSLTYRELAALSDRIAGHLAGHGVRPGDRVAICLERSPLLIATILAVLKTGAAYIPLDPSYPAARLAFIIADSQARLLVTTPAYTRSLTGEAAPGLVVVDGDLTALPEAAPPRVEADPGDLAYLIYTSGSTGRPRGAMNTHRSVVNTLLGTLQRYPLNGSDVWLQLTSPGFDVAAFEQFMPLICGGTVVYSGDADRRDGAALTRLLARHGVTVMVAVPSLLRALRRPDLAGVRALIVAGEPADVPDTRFFAERMIVINGYGPTEAAILATTYQADPDLTSARVPIGTALPGTAAHVIDRHGRPAAANVPGELYLGGAGVGAGYWNNPEQTRRGFTTLPALGSERLYRTGDRVRRLPDGDLDFLGRLDDQVKLRGFRIELGEVEAGLASCPGVHEAAAVVAMAAPADAEPGQDADLYAFIVGTATPEQARAHLARTLPGYMIPTAIVTVPELPTSGNGKIDRKELAARVSRPRSSVPALEGEEPGTPLETTLVALWRRVLPGAAPRLSEDFFAAGGHSLRLIRLLDLIEDECGVRLGVADFLAEPTPRAVAREIERLRAGAVTASAVMDRSQVRLDPSIGFAGPVAAGPGPVLLTGATGFVGAHLLQELLARTDTELLCLMRARSAVAGRLRLREVIDGYGLAVDADDPRIVVLPGDLARPDLGLADRDRAARAALVLHAGAHVHHLSGYDRLAAPNVGGTQELLRLAALGRPASFHHVSTLSVFTGQGRTVTEATPAGGERHFRGRGYAASKWAAEHLVEQAAARGARAGIQRLGQAGASAATGAADRDDMLSRLLITSARLGCYPQHPALTWQVMPVDVMARAMVALALNDHATAPGPGPAVHHLHHARQVAPGDYLAVHDRMHGTVTEATDLATWLDRLRSAPAEQHLPALPYRDHLAGLAAGGSGDRFDNTSTLEALQRLGVTPPDLDEDYLRRYWSHLEAAP